MNILCGGPVSEDRLVFDAHIASLVAQSPALDYKGIDNSPVPLKEPAGFKKVYWRRIQSLGEYKEDKIRWNNRFLKLVGELRNEMRDSAITRGYTHLFMVDSDIICGEGVLERLLSCNKDFVSALVWTKSAFRVDSYFANAWVIRNNKQAPAPEELISKLRSGGVHEVETTGGCYLISREALKKISFELQRGTWSEDVSVALTCRKAGIPIHICCDGVPTEHRRVR